MPATAAQSLQDYSLDLQILPLDAFGSPLRSVTKITITNTTAAAVGATTMSLSAASAVTIRGGSALSFVNPSGSGTYGRQQVLFINDVNLTTTASTVTVSPLTRSIAASNTASFVTGMYPLLGITQLDLNNQETQVDTTNFGSDTGTEMQLIRVQRQLTVNGISMAGDQALETIVKPCGGLSSAFVGREIYAVATKPNGEIFEGAAEIMALNFPASQNEVDKYSFNLNFQGNTFRWTPPYYF